VADDDEISRALKRLGISDLQKLTASDLKVLLDAYLKSKALDTATFKLIVGRIDPLLRVVLDGLTAFSRDQTQVSSGTLSIIQQAIKVLEQELARDYITAEERMHVRGLVFDLVIEARKESTEHRNFLLKLASVGGTLALGALGVLAMALRGERNTDRHMS
jgi:hypothetical protein